MALYARHMTDAKTSPVLDRFLRYVTYDTQSREDSTTYPSTPGQLVLLRDLVAELQAIGVADAAMDEHGYVMATIPATTAKADVPVIGFIAHVDTSPEMSGAGREADRPPRTTTAAICVLPDDPDGRAAGGRHRPTSASASATTSSPRRARRCSAPTTRAAWPRS